MRSKAGAGRGALFVTATPPTPNGDLHLGHFAGPYLAADVLARHQRRKGDPAVLATGIDDHQSYTDLRARQDDTTAQAVAEKFGDRMEAAWRQLGVSFDVVSRPQRSKHHRQTVEQFVTTLHARGHLIARTRPLPWCPSCAAWAFEAYVTGGCPHCASPACGNACEVCCRPNDCADLVDPRCNRCDGPVEMRDCERLYFPLEPHRARLEKLWSEAVTDPHLAALCDTMAEGGLPEIAVSHPSPWGIPVPVAGFEDHTIYVWFEMAGGYLATATECAEARSGEADWRTVWADGRVVQCFGIDNGYFHAVLFPALMTAFDPQTPLPAAFVVNEFYRLEGLKFSTSRRHAVWVDEALREVPADHLRLYLCLDRPTGVQTSFSWSQFRNRMADDLLVRWSGWLEGAQHRFERASETPARVDAEGEEPLPAPVTSLLTALDESCSVAAFSPRRAVRLLDMLASEGAETGAASEYGYDTRNGRERAAASAAAEARILAVFAAGLAPFAPTMAQELWSALGLPGMAASVDWAEVPTLRPRWQEIRDLPGACPTFGRTAGGAR